ncbi:MAG: SDR family oxidoreductase, partial [Acidimicrobiia bacterium]
VAAAVPNAIAVACDAGDPHSVAALIDTARNTFGEIDLFCANAGIGIGSWLESDDMVWDEVWRVNVMQHVWAARHLTPGWIERGSGHLLVTASAAGLLSQIGSAPYTLSKHAAVAFAEWFAITYGENGLRCSCLCPQGVNTVLLTGDTLDATAANVVRAAGRVLEPAEVADSVVAGLRADDFLILPHREVADYVVSKATDRGKWIRAMQRLQARVRA